MTIDGEAWWEIVHAVAPRHRHLLMGLLNNHWNSWGRRLPDIHRAHHLLGMSHYIHSLDNFRDLPSFLLSNHSYLDLSVFNYLEKWLLLMNHCVSYLTVNSPSKDRGKSVPADSSHWAFLLYSLSFRATHEWSFNDIAETSNGTSLMC